MLTCIALTNPFHPAILPVTEVDFYGAKAPFVSKQSHVIYPIPREQVSGGLFLKSLTANGG
jgi:hypothetical protein